MLHGSTRGPCDDTILDLASGSGDGAILLQVVAKCGTLRGIVRCAFRVLVADRAELKMGKFEILMGLIAVLTLAIPLVILAIDLKHLAFPHRVIIRNDAGQVLGEISAEIVTKAGAAKELKQLSERIKQSGHVITRST